MPEKLRDKIVRLNALPEQLLHEGCHYLTARLLGIEAEFTLDHIKMKFDGPSWRVIAVTLAPAAVGLFLLIGLSWLAIRMEAYWLVLLGLVFNVAWQPSCLRDFYCVWYLIKFGDWPDDDEGPRRLPWPLGPRE